MKAHSAAIRLTASSAVNIGGIPLPSHVLSPLLAWRPIIQRARRQLRQHLIAITHEIHIAALHLFLDLRRNATLRATSCRHPELRRPLQAKHSTEMAPNRHAHSSRLPYPL
jgi:hypothetical protein